MSSKIFMGAMLVASSFLLGLSMSNWHTLASVKDGLPTLTCYPGDVYVVHSDYWFGRNVQIKCLDRREA